MERVTCVRNECNKIKSGDYELCDSCYGELIEFRKSWAARKYMTKNEIRIKYLEFLSSRIGSFVFISDKDIDAELNRLAKG